MSEPRRASYSAWTRLQAILLSGDVAPVLLVLIVAGLILGTLLVLGIGTANVISRMMEPHAAGGIVLACTAIEMIGLLWNYRALLYIGVIAMSFIWAMLMYGSLTSPGAPPGAIATYTTLALAGAWVWVRVWRLRL